MSESSYSSPVDYGPVADSKVENSNFRGSMLAVESKDPWDYFQPLSSPSSKSGGSSFIRSSAGGSAGPRGGFGSSGSSGSYQKQGSSFFDLFFGNSGSSDGFAKAFEAGLSTPRGVASSVGQPQLQFNSFSMPNINVPAYGNGGRISVPSLSADDLEFDVPKLSSGGSSPGRSSSGGMGKMLLGVAVLGIGVVVFKRLKKAPKAQ